MPKYQTLKKPLFYFEELRPWDKVALWLNAFLTILFLSINSYCSNEVKQTFLITYTTSLQLLTYLLNYKSLRNLTVYLSWLSFAVLDLILYFVLRNDSAYMMHKGNVSGFLAITIVLLLLFQALRIISIKLQKWELVAPTKGGGKDLFDNRIVSVWDYIFFVIYMSSWFGLVVLIL